MADPHIHSPMDWLDYFTVIVYRSGLTLAAPALLMLAWQQPYANYAVLIAATCSAATLHIYSKQIRFILQVTTWAGLVVALCGFVLLGVGGALVTLGGLAFKEHFCFKVPGLRWQPMLLAALWFSLLFQQTLFTEILGSLSALLFLLLALAKWRMPLHFDIGDKSKFEN